MKTDVDILLHTNQFLNENLIAEEMRTDFKVLNVHLQKVHALPIIYLVDQRYESILRLFQCLTATKQISK